MRYEIDENNAIRIYQDGADVPFIYQPDYPDTTPFADRADAIAWAESKIAELTDIEAPAAKNFPTEEPQPNPRKLAEQKLQVKKSAFAKLEALGLTAEEIAALSK